jgi:hypothetical protein
MELPAGCEYVETGEGQNTIVRCDLLAADVLKDMSDPKEACRQVYGHQVVAYATIPVQDVTCSESTDAAGATCGTMPWNLGREG